MKTAYDVLGVPRNASNERIRTAFRKAAKTYHPDLNAGDPTAELLIRLVITAYEILKTPHKRAAYDRYLGERRRETVRHFALASVPTLLLGSIVALAISLSIWPSNTQDASAPQPISYMVSAQVRPDVSQQMAAAGNSSRQQVNRDSKSNWGSAPDYEAPHRLQAAGSLPQKEVYAALARGPGVEVNSKPIAFAGRAHETELARREPGRVDAAAPPSSNPPDKPPLEESAAIFVASQIGGWSSSNTSDLGSLISAYADNVLYYGSRKSRKAILLEKSRALERWPERIYDVQRDSMMVRCASNVCQVRGRMAWQTHNAHRGTAAGGISKFDYKITPSDDRFRILSESGSVVERYRHEDGRNHSRTIKVAAHRHRYRRHITSNESQSHGHRGGFGILHMSISGISA
jgi:hypothetical protein